MSYDTFIANTSDSSSQISQQITEKKRTAVIPVLQKALDLAPADPDGTILLADAYAAEKKSDDALHRISMQQHPNDADVMLRSGMIFEKLQQWDDAQRVYARLFFDHRVVAVELQRTLGMAEEDDER